jgi:DNA-binding TFAR19-related protein (PDSD5 family)
MLVLSVSQCQPRAAQGTAGSGGLTPEAQQEQEEARQQQEERRQAMLVQILQPQARERRVPHLPILATENLCLDVLKSLHYLSGLLKLGFAPKLECVLHRRMSCYSCVVHAVARIALVKPEKARGVESLILQMAQRGQITEKASH